MLFFGYETAVPSQEFVKISRHKRTLSPHSPVKNMGVRIPTHSGVTYGIVQWFLSFSELDPKSGHNQ